MAIDVVTLRPIASGEELCIRYADVTLPRRERRDYLYKGWGFWCMCDKCKYEGCTAKTVDSLVTSIHDLFAKAVLDGV